MSDKLKAALIAFALIIVGIAVGEWGLETAGIIPRFVMLPGPTDLGLAITPFGLACGCFATAVAVLAAGFSRKEMQDLVFGRVLCWGVIIICLFGGVAAFGYGMLIAQAGSDAAWTGIIGGISLIGLATIALLVERFLSTRMSEKRRYG